MPKGHDRFSVTCCTTSSHYDEVPQPLSGQWTAIYNSIPALRWRTTSAQCQCACHQSEARIPPNSAALLPHAPTASRGRIFASLPAHPGAPPSHARVTASLPCCLVHPLQKQFTDCPRRQLCRLPRLPPQSPSGWGRPDPMPDQAQPASAPLVATAMGTRPAEALLAVGPS